MATEKVGIIVLSYGAGGQYRPLLDGLLAGGVKPDAILVVHNPADPRELSPLLPPGCELLRTNRNLGYAGGMNLGIARMMDRGVDLILLLTHDARLRAGALGALLGAARRHADFGVLGPVQLFAHTEEPFSYGGMTSASGMTSHRTKPPAGADEISPCDWVDGGTMLIRAEVFDRVGAFDERFWGYCEESDLCLRARRAGFGVGVVLAAEADQDPGGTKRPGAWAYLLTRNGIEYARRAAGARGLMAVASLSVWQVAFSLFRAGLRAVRLRSGDPREPWVLAVGTARGLVDRFRGRWGPPPSDLPGIGDLSNA